jgi:F-type H+-transporting ATPase subunit gamma
VSNTIASLRRRISGARDLKDVVGSMKALAAANIGQYERACEALQDYYRTVELGLSRCLRQSSIISFAPSMPSTDARRVGSIVFGSDQGLVGRFNEALAEFAAHELQGKSRPIKVWAVGERMVSLMLEQGYAQVEQLSVPNSVNAIAALIGQILIDVEADRSRSGVAEIHVFHNQPRPGAAYEPVVNRLLPLDAAWATALVSMPWPTERRPELLGPPDALVRAFIQEYLYVSLFRGCAESLASENASRLAAMQRAERNIEDSLETLNRSFHRIRQASIDEELFDVISGYEALSRRDHAGAKSMTRIPIAADHQ